MSEVFKPHDVAQGLMDIRSQLHESIALVGRVIMECWRDGKLLWTEDGKNTIVNQGLEYLFNVAFSPDLQTSQQPFYVGLINDSGFSQILASDTSQSHPGWTEFTNTTGGRIQWLNNGEGYSIGGSAVQNPSPREFTINATGTVHGSFLTSSSSSGTDGNAASKLIAARQFAQGSRSVVANDTLKVTHIISVTTS